jgi:uncharacterized protein YodC (DUF2158 family)
MDIKVGSVIKLRSGGPAMVVESLQCQENGTMATCVWFGPGEEPKRHAFSVEILELVSSGHSTR